MSIRDNMIQQVLGNPGKYSIQQLEAAMKSGSLPAYVVVPIIQDKVQQQKQMQAAMAMQQQPPQSTVAEQVMQEAGQMGGGVEQLPSNLPQEYAGGGIVAFSPGGIADSDIDVEAELDRQRLKDLAETGVARGFDIFTAPNRLRQIFTRDVLGRPLRAMGLPIERAPASVYGSPSYEALEKRRAAAGYGPPPTPAVSDEDLVRQGDVGIRQMLKDTLTDVGGTAPPGMGQIPSVGGGGVKLTPVPAAFDYTTLVQNMPKKLEEAAEKATKAEQEKLDAYGKSMFEGRKGRISERRKQIEKEAEVEKWLNVIAGGLDMMASKSPTALGGIAEGGKTIVAGMVKSKAAQRLAREKLEDAQDNLEIQELAEKKGNYRAAQEAGERAKRDIQYSTSLDMQARQGTESAQLARAQLARQGEIGMAQLQQGAASTNAQLQLGYRRLEILEQQIAAGNKRAEAVMMSAIQKANAEFNNSPERRAIEVKYKGKLDTVDAQRELQMARKQYLALSMASMGSGEKTGARSASELLED